MKKTDLNRAFKELRKAGYFARQNFMCCQSCGWANIPDGSEKVCFYHNQDAEDYKKRGEVYLAWKGDAKEIKKIFKEIGFFVKWDGDDNTRIFISNDVAINK